MHPPAGHPSTTSRSNRQPIAVGLFLTGLWIAGLAPAPSWAQLQDGTGRAGSTEASVQPEGTAENAEPNLLSRLRRAEATTDERASIADAILSLRAADPVLQQIVTWLGALGETPATEPDGLAVRALFAAIARTPSPPPGLYAPTVSVAQDSDSPLSQDAIRALGSFRTREAAAVLVAILSAPETGDRQRLAGQSLVALSGREDIAPGGWSGWLSEAVALSEREWQAKLIAAHVRRADRLASESRLAERQLAEAWSRIHLLTPAEQRSAVLVQLLQSPISSLRTLGFDLVNREIGESRQLEPSVAAAAITLLDSPEALVRARAAQLLNRLAAPEAEAPVLAALARETDPRAADALLLAVSRWASPAAVAPTLKWLRASPTTRLRAASTAWTLYRAGVITRDEDRRAVLEGVRQVPDAEVTPAVCRLLAVFGEGADIERLHRLLGAESPTLRARAADALALLEGELDTVLTAATDDAALFEAAAKTLRNHALDARGYDVLSRLPAPSPEVRSRVLREYAAFLPTVEIVRLARLSADPSEAVGLLQPLLSAGRAADDASRTQLAEGLLLLAQTHIALNNPNDALRVLAVIPEPRVPEATTDPGSKTPPATTGSEPVAQPEIQRLRVMLLVWLNRLDEASQIVAVDGDGLDETGIADAWLDGFERALVEPHAGEIAKAITKRFPELSAEQAARLHALQQQLAAANEADAPESGG